MKAKYIMLLLIVVVTVSCSSQRKVQTSRSNLKKIENEITGKNWNLVEMNGSAVKPDGSEPYIRFNRVDNSVSGNTGCNSFFGNFVLSEENKIKFSPLASTKIACMGKNPEEEYLNALSKTESYSIGANELIFKDISGNFVLKFQAVFSK